MDGDIKVLYHYLQMFINGQPVNRDSRVDCLTELQSTCESLSDRLARLEQKPGK